MAKMIALIALGAFLLWGDIAASAGKGWCIRENDGLVCSDEKFMKAYVDKLNPSSSGFRCSGTEIPIIVWIDQWKAFAAGCLAYSSEAARALENAITAYHGTTFRFNRPEKEK